MRRVVALLIAIGMTTGCATYEGARTARNAGIVMGVVGVAAITGGLVLNRQDDNACPSGGGGNNCDGFSEAGAGAFALTLLGIGLIPYALVFGIVGASGMEKHSPDAQRREQARAEQARIERERAARDEREAA